MTDDSTSDIPPVQPTKTNYQLIAVLAAVFGVPLVLAAIGAGAYFKHQQKRVFARAEERRSSKSLAENPRGTMEAFGNDAATSAPSSRDIDALSDLLKRVAEIKTSKQVEECFDMERLYREIQAVIGNQQIQQIIRKPEAYKKFREGFTKKLAARSPLARFVFTEIKRVKFSDRPDEAIVFSQHRTAEGGGVKARWWVARSRGKWKIYDFEVLEKGVRSSVNIAAAMDETGPHGFTPRYFEAMSAAHEAAGLLGQGEFDQAEQKLRATLDVPLPKPLAAWRLSQLAIVETSRNHWDEVLDLTSRAAELNPDMPLLLKHRAQALNGLGRFQEAAAEAREYIAELGGDDHGSFLLGTALAGMEKNDEAADAFREGLDDYSDSVDNLVGLAGVLPGEQMQEVADRFSQFEQPEARFSEVADQLVTQENATALAAVLERNRELAPLDPHNSYYEGELHRLRGE